MAHTLLLSFHILVSVTSFAVMFAGLYAVLRKDFPRFKKRADLLLSFIIGSATTGVGLMLAGAPVGRTCVSLVSYLTIALGVYAWELRQYRKNCPVIAES